MHVKPELHVAPALSTVPLVSTVNEPVTSARHGIKLSSTGVAAVSSFCGRRHLVSSTRQCVAVAAMSAVFAGAVTSYHRRGEAWQWRRCQQFLRAPSPRFIDAATRGSGGDVSSFRGRRHLASSTRRSVAVTLISRAAFDQQIQVLNYDVLTPATQAPQVTF